MYLHLGNDCVVKDCDIIGIFDLEKSSISKDTKDFLRNATKKDNVTTVSYEMPKTFVVTKTQVFISQISSATLKARGKFKK